MCRVISSAKPENAATALEDMMDDLSNWGLDPVVAHRLQCTVVKTALQELFTSFGGGQQFWKLWGLQSKPKQETVRCLLQLPEAFRHALMPFHTHVCILCVH